MSGAVRRSAGAALTSLLAACTVSPPADGTGGAATADGTDAVPDGSLDWHVLVLLPFGAALSDSPRPLHEVLLFHDETQVPAGIETTECYSVDGAPPRFIDAQPADYLLCFTHDRLNRIEATVHLPAAAAAGVFARACALWRLSTLPTAGGDSLCAGKDGGIAVSARLDQGPDGSPATLSMTLSPAAAEAPAS